jgi:pimeloyl-ACP methyl ester carboxylesterase
MAHSGMPRAQLSSGIELEYETFGDPADPTLLLVMGFTAQLIAWDERFCRLFVDAGFHVVRFDNRDCGLSSHLDGVEVDIGELMGAALGGSPMPEVPYLLSDMAADAVGLLDHLGVTRAHVMGASMGGMIVQTMAIEHPGHLASAVSVMSTTGDRAVGQASDEARAALLTPPPTDREGYIKASGSSLVFGSKRYGNPEVLAANAARAYDRAFYPEGAPRQLAAIFASGDRTEALREVDVPTLVIHGRDDTLIDVSGGIATAEAIPGADLLVLADMGHDLPEALWPQITAAVIGHCRVHP